MKKYPLFLLCIGLANSVAAQVLHVGPGQTYTKPCAAIAAVADGMTIQIDAAGNYDGDVCAWSKNGLTLQGVNGRPHIAAAGQNSQGKAIWVIAGNDTVVDNIEFSGCTVPDGNGAGIRQEGVNLTVRHAYFHDNQDGLLAGDKAGSTILVEYSEFSHNGAGDGQTHNIYINHIDTLIFHYNYSHGAVVGHLLKSRARTNFVLYNRLTGETGGTESYELSMPSGGTTYVIGNLVEQPPSLQNGAMLDYLSEPATANPDGHLFVVNNTFVNDRGNGTFLQIAGTTPAVARNNIFYGGGTLSSQPTSVLDHNYSGNAPMFVDAAGYDYRLLSGSPAIDAGAEPGTGLSSQSLRPEFQYVHPTAASPRAHERAYDIGAFEGYGDGLFADSFD